MKLTGHRTEAIYRRYAIVSPSDLQAAAQRLADTIGDTGGPAAAAARLPLTDAAQPSRFMEHGRIAQRTERSPYKAKETPSRNRANLQGWIDSEKG
jgi:hypothetical protein